MNDTPRRAAWGRASAPRRSQQRSHRYGPPTRWTTRAAHWRRHLRALPIPKDHPAAFIIGFAFLVAGLVSVVLAISMLFAGLVVLGAIVLVGMGGVAATRAVVRRTVKRLGLDFDAKEQRAEPAEQTSPETTWSQARDRFAALQAEYAGYECDPMAVLRLPALADVRVPSTARFVEAFAEAQALATDTPPPAEHAAAFAAAVDRAERAWEAARDAAERIRLSRLSPEERATVDRVVKLLTTARETDNEAERHAAYARARSELAKLDRSGVLRIPQPAQAALDAAARGALPS